jgi:hypothetical protein
MRRRFTGRRLIVGPLLRCPIRRGAASRCAPVPILSRAHTPGHRRFVAVIAIVGGLVLCLGLPSVTGAETTGRPTLVLQENCYKDQGVQVYGVRVGVTGFPPNVEFTASLSSEYINPDGTYSPGGVVGPSTFTTDPNGEFIAFTGTVGVKSIFTLTVDSPYIGGTVTKTLAVTCEPTSPEAPQGCVSGTVASGPKVNVRRVVWPKTVAKLLSKGVRTRAGCDQACQVTATVSLTKAVPGIAKGTVIARGAERTDAGQAGWVTAEVVRSARTALLGRAVGVDLAPLLRVTATAG